MNVAIRTEISVGNTIIALVEKNQANVKLN
jgi:hypothetical protein